ncbi:hypothetical protein BC835DRAFT_657920 [Cytidiella melzeri]|nr:hypothetical protein BC835DRAFT_657920 [Cytidiella melzeri]
MSLKACVQQVFSTTTTIHARTYLVDATCRYNLASVRANIQWHIARHFAFSTTLSSPSLHGFEHEKGLETMYLGLSPLAQRCLITIRNRASETYTFSQIDHRLWEQPRLRLDDYVLDSILGNLPHLRRLSIHLGGDLQQQKPRSTALQRPCPRGTSL